jgi:hypothetical protein
MSTLVVGSLTSCRVKRPREEQKSGGEKLEKTESHAFFMFVLSYPVSFCRRRCRLLLLVLGMHAIIFFRFIAKAREKALDAVRE